MSKKQIESILDANRYLINCKIDGKCKKRYEDARKYLNITVDKILLKRDNVSITKSIFISFLYFLLNINY